jgi:hypothetical protein
MTDENALKRNGELANLSVTSYVTGPLQKFGQTQLSANDSNK